MTRTEDDAGRQRRRNNWSPPGGTTTTEMRAASRRKRRNRISEAWTSHTVSMLRSPARCVLSRGARQFLDRLEIELCDHGGNDNGRLPLTFEDLVEYGIHRNSIAPAQREAIALGFAVLTRRGHGGNAESRQPNLWRLTYVAGRDGIEPTHEWRRIKTLEQAEAMAATARAAKDPLAVQHGEQAVAKAKHRNRYRKPRSVSISETKIEMPEGPISDSAITGSVRNPRLPSISRSGDRASNAARVDAVACKEDKGTSPSTLCLRPPTNLLQAEESGGAQTIEPRHMVGRDGRILGGRLAILSALGNGPLHIQVIASVIDRDDSRPAVDQLLHKMARAGEIVRTGRGIYGLPPVPQRDTAG
jgi:hypothetical protein